MDPTCEVELVAGSADPIVLLLDAGVARSVGTRGHWRVWADGVLDVHGYLVWLEGELWARSASRMQPVYLNGAAAVEWTKVPPGARIAMGSAVLRFRAEEDDTANFPLDERNAPPTLADPDDDEEPTHVDPPRAPPSRSDVVPRGPVSPIPQTLPMPEDWSIDIEVPRSKRG